jgi:hypothetical protein
MSKLMRLISGLSALALIVGTLVLPTATTAQAAPKMTAKVSPAKPMPGETFTLTGRIATVVVRPVTLQRRDCRTVKKHKSCKWTTVASAKTTSRGSYSLTSSTTRSSVKMRVVAPTTKVGKKSYRRLVSPTKKVSTVKQKAKLSLATTLTAADPIAATLTLYPTRKGRPVQVQALVSGTWTVVGTGIETAKGTATVQVRATAAGRYNFRATAPSWHGAKAVISPQLLVVVNPSATVGTGTELCAGAGTTGKSLMTYSPLTKPALHQAVTDPDFGTIIRRVTDVATQWPGATVAVPAYPTIPAWNADESYLLLYITQPSKGWALFNGKTYAYLRMLDINPADVEQFYWSTADPDLIYYVDQNSFVLTRLHVSTGAKEALHNFKTDISSGVLTSVCSGADLVSGGGDPFFTSYDNDLIGLGCRKTGGSSTAYEGFSYRLSTNTIGTTQHLVDVVPQAAPSGTLRFLAGTTSSRVLDATNNSVLRTLPWNGEEHSDMLRNAAGDDLVAGVQYDSPTGNNGTLMVANLTTGSVSTIIGEAKGDPYPPTGTLVSGKAFKNPGWVAVGATGNGLNAANPASTYLTQEIMLANVDTGQVCRLAHHRSFGYDANSSNQNYWAQPNVVISPSGTRVLFPSDWYGGSTVDTYVIELPGYQP